MSGWRQTSRDKSSYYDIVLDHVLDAFDTACHNNDHVTASALIDVLEGIIARHFSRSRPHLVRLVIAHERLSLLFQAPASEVL